MNPHQKVILQGSRRMKVSPAASMVINQSRHIDNYIVRCYYVDNQILTLIKSG